jgi:hypothetical protein
MGKHKVKLTKSSTIDNFYKNVLLKAIKLTKTLKMNL